MNFPIAIAEKVSSKLNRVKQRFTGKSWPNKSIVYYTGHTDYQWSPESLKTGLGGADARIVYLSREWVKLGYSVAVYSNCGDREGLYDGVNYYHYSKFNPYDRFDTLIMWQFAWRIQFPIAANRVWLDLGSVLLPKEVTYEKLKGYDKIFCKNNFHRSLLPEIPDGNIAIIPNGFDSSFLKFCDREKDPNKIIYASNYIRGLERMLEFGWPLISREIPEAKLHIYYGWPREIEPEWKQKMLDLMKQPGVIEHGKVGREQLMEEKSTSSINYYGCTFAELDCNTVRESALVGAVPVTTDYAGLRDKNYCVKVPGNPYDRDTQEAVAWKLIELMRNPSQLAEIRAQFARSVRDETWERVAQLWLNEQ
ncbi:glycosyltransferase family 4 protein [Roseofilum casamattae]|uniref:Glycosyltransferase family 4 protein n=1 Tax=Roseofilum casamattae BLCC-M143 TaxID=3022442 RepID=A0ABT7C1J9_9CYAN|nr:glycosyltransferase family 4 protein [Roseofilum casamattae]MDJ1185322.1 glycosyltransferase family 4 protein [Roseofilum casamattae BLCC-M143]